MALGFGSVETRIMQTLAEADDGGMGIHMSSHVKLDLRRHVEV
jgi:hypothetical protein